MEGHTDINNSQVGGGSYETAPKQGSFFPSTDPSPAPVQPGEDMHRGWVKLWRKWRDHEMASDPNATLVFLHLLTEARREPKKNRRYGYVIQRGQTDLTLGQLEELTGLSRQAVREALKRLVRYETISRTTQNGTVPSITTITNFDTYNPDANGNNTPNNTRDTTRATPEQPLPEKVKKGKNTTLSDKSDAEREPSKAEVRFSQFWSFYPRKIGKGKAWAVFKRLSSDDQHEAVEQAEAYAQAFDMAPDARKQFFKHPTTWLNGRCWEDDHAEWELLIEGK